MVLDNLRSNIEVANKIIFEVAKLIEEERQRSKSHFLLKDRLITPKRKYPKLHKREPKDIYWFLLGLFDVGDYKVKVRIC